MRVRVTDRCSGHGRCYGYAPDVFEDDELGYSRVKAGGEFDEDLREAAVTAQVGCPEDAIEIDN
jgi:ferredoxin